MSADIGRHSTLSDQQIWTLSDVLGYSGNTPKVPGSRPGRPTKTLIKGMKLNSFGSNEANDVANAPNGSGESIVASPYKIVRITSATLARERSMRCPSTSLVTGSMHGPRLLILKSRSEWNGPSFESFGASFTPISAVTNRFHFTESELPFFHSVESDESGTFEATANPKHDHTLAVSRRNFQTAPSTNNPNHMA